MEPVLVVSIHPVEISLSDGWLLRCLYKKRWLGIGEVGLSRLKSLLIDILPLLKVLRLATFELLQLTSLRSLAVKKFLILQDHSLKHGLAFSFEHDVKALRNLVLSEDDIAIVVLFDLNVIAKDHQTVVCDVSEQNLILKSLHFVLEVVNLSEVLYQNGLEELLIDRNQIAICH